MHLSNKNYVGIYYAYVPTLVDAYCGCVISLPPGEEPGPFSFGDATGKITGADGICGHLGYCGQCYSWNYADPPQPTTLPNTANPTAAQPTTSNPTTLPTKESTTSSSSSTTTTKLSTTTSTTVDTTLWYVDSNAGLFGMCVQNCDGPSPCGGIDQWEEKFTSVQQCCEEKFPSSLPNECTDADVSDWAPTTTTTTTTTKTTTSTTTSTQSDHQTAVMETTSKVSQILLFRLVLTPRIVD